VGPGAGSQGLGVPALDSPWWRLQRFAAPCDEQLSTLSCCSWLPAHPWPAHSPARLRCPLFLPAHPAKLPLPTHCSAPKAPLAAASPLCFQCWRGPWDLMSASGTPPARCRERRETMPACSAGGWVDGLPAACWPCCMYAKRITDTTMHIILPVPPVNHRHTLVSQHACTPCSWCAPPSPLPAPIPAPIPAPSLPPFLPRSLPPCRSKLDEFNEFVARTKMPHLSLSSRSRSRPGSSSGGTGGGSQAAAAAAAAGAAAGGSSGSAAPASQQEGTGRPGRLQPSLLPTLVIVDDLPHAAGPEQRRQIGEALADLAAGARFPVVVVATETSGKAQQERGLSAAAGTYQGLHKVGRGLVQGLQQCWLGGWATGRLYCFAQQPMLPASPSSLLHLPARLPVCPHRRSSLLCWRRSEPQPSPSTPSRPST
jgi:uncharacterized membrane protein YgcG